MTVKELINNPNYREHHSATRRGYVSRKCDGIVREYNGRFGRGYLLISPRWDTTQYVTYTYYIENDKD